MARQHNPTPVRRTYRGKEISLTAISIGDDLHHGPHRLQLRLHPSNQLNIGMGACGGKGQQLFKIV